MSRLEELRKALLVSDAFDALSAVRGLIPDDGAGAQEVVVYGFACILETNSAGLSIVFDRFDDDEIGKMELSLEKMGATKTLEAFRTLDAAFRQLLAEGEERLDAGDRLVGAPETRRIDGACEAHVAEMEASLLRFCKDNVEALAVE
jgi:hypothetical protein